MITLEQDRTLTEQYNFDQIISKISTKLIDIQNDNIDQHHAHPKFIDTIYSAVHLFASREPSFLLLRRF